MSDSARPCTGLLHDRSAPAVIRDDEATGPSATPERRAKEARRVDAADLVIFDCDGVLVDSESIRARLLAHMLAEQGVPVGAAEAQRLFRGQRLARCVDYVERTDVCTLPEDLLDRYRAAIMAEFECSLRPVPGVGAALEAIDASVCVASSSPRPYIDAVLGLTQLQGFFGDNVFSAYELKAWKPSHGLFPHAAAAFATAPERCTVVEDSIAVMSPSETRPR